MVKRILGAFLILALVSCHDKKSNHKKDLYKAETFFDTFRPLRFPYTVVDTAIASRTDTATIPPASLKTHLPDSVSNKILADNAVAHPVGRIDILEYRYIIVALQRGSKTSWYVLTFNSQNKFLTYMPLLNNQYDDGYRHSLGINQEPTFTLGKSKKDAKDNLLYTNEGFAYNTATHRFSLVINNTNENLPGSDKVFVPIDTLPSTFAYSGDYQKDKQNILVLRDGSRPNEYVFFYHFDKTDDDPDAKGEIKGKLRMVSANSGIYQQGGDPCVIDFNFKGKNVHVKEEGNCANYRGSNVLFDDSFSKVSRQKAKPEHNGKKK